MTKTGQDDLAFPKQFLWGASTSAHQVEGGNHNNWSVWELENAKSLAKSAEYKIGHFPIWPKIQRLASSPDNYISGRAIDHYNRYESDFDIAKKMNLNAFRFSIEWSRIEPEEGKWDVAEIEHYRRYIAALKRRGIEPMVTLYHWTVPVWFMDKGAFGHASNIKYFVRFADKVIEELGKELRYVTTINEPDTVTMLGYYTQEHPPAVHSVRKMLRVYRNHLKAHKQVYSILKARSRRFKVGFVKSYAYVGTVNDTFVSKFMARLHQYLVNTIPLRYVGRKQDFIGVNYYHTDMWDGFTLHPSTRFNDHTEAVASDLGWLMRPENLESVLLGLKKYKKPIFVMETGVADRDDRYRKDWLNGTIRSVLAARQAGVNVQGYLHWSMFDNFEWAYGRWPCFGLIGIDYEDDFKRIPRKSAIYYASVVKKARGL